jgi:hypothetical protein
MYIVSEFHLDNYCCTSQAHNTITQIFSGLFDRDGLDDYLRKKIVEFSDLKITEIPAKYLQIVIEKGLLIERRSECGCGPAVFIKKSEPHKIIDDDMRRLTMKEGIDIKELIEEGSYSDESESE